MIHQKVGSMFKISVGVVWAAVDGAQGLWHEHTFAVVWGIQASIELHASGYPICINLDSVIC